MPHGAKDAKEPFALGPKYEEIPVVPRRIVRKNINRCGFGVNSKADFAAESIASNR